MSQHSTRLIKLYVGYAEQDENLLRELNSHLSRLRRLNLFDIWVSQAISTNSTWEIEILSHLDSAQIILFLVSPDFLASGYCYSKEVQRAIERHESGNTRIVPILLRPVDWEETPLGYIQTLPRSNMPVVLWKNREDAWTGITETIQFICNELFTSIKALQNTSDIHKKRSNFSIQSTKNTLELFDVFVKSGVPSVTFVEREDYISLKMSLAQPGRGVIVEGPSGVGKTTAVKKAIEDLTINRPVNLSTQIITPLSARDPNDREKLKTLLSWHIGTVIIDDFHRLDTTQQSKIADYLKYLADTEPLSKKLVIVGIPQTGQVLVNSSFDLATRFDVFSLRQVKDELILKMIEKGERALNINFENKTDIALAAIGSLNIAQYLCFNICQKVNVVETLSEWRNIPCDIETAVNGVMASLERKFGDTIKNFAALGGQKDSTSLKLLQELARSDSGFLSLLALKNKKPDLTQNIDKFINNNLIDKFYRENPESTNHLHFDPIAQALVIDDPQLLFYLARLRFPTLAKGVGKINLRVQQKAFICYSHEDANWLKRLQIHLKPIEREGIIDLWNDTKIKAGEIREREIQDAIQSAKIAVVLVSANFLASDFINEYELPLLLSRAETGGTAILPVIVSPCLLQGSGLDIFQPVNSLDKPLTTMGEAEQDQTLVNLAMIIRNKIAAQET